MNASTEPTVAVETITPEIASHYLSKNPRNRKTKAHRIERYARDLEEGRWQFNGAMICFDTQGQLVDGQHRLLAIVKSGIPLKTLVAHGLDQDSILTMDAGAVRTAGDQLGMLGHADSGTLAGASYLVCRIKLGPLDKAGLFPSTIEVIQFARDNADLAHSVKMGRKCSHVMGAAIIAGLHYLFSEKNKAQADEFLEKLATGAMLQEGDPIYTLRERLIRERAATRKLPRITIIVFCIKAWNAFRKGEPIKQLTYRPPGPKGGSKPEPFPIIE